MGFFWWTDINHAAIGAAMFPLGLSFFYLAICITVWTCQGCMASFLIDLDQSSRPTNRNLIHIMAIGTGMELLCLIFSTLGLIGATRRSMCLLVTWAIYLPLYILYQIAVIVMMIKVSAAAAAGAIAVTSPPDEFYGVLKSFSAYQPYYVFIPIIIFWGIQILINVVGEAITIVTCRSFSDISDDAFKHR